MMKRFSLLLSVFLIFPMLAQTQVNPTGIPLIHNFSTVKINFGEQNWTIAQDKRGVMYFGNNDDGILEYDGTNWRNIKVPNNSIVRSLAADEHGTIFAGLVGDFGYLAPDASGRLQYKSLSKGLDSTHRQFTNVWKIYCGNGQVYFSASKRLFIYNYRNVKEYIGPETSFWGFLVDNKLYYGNFDRGLLEFNGDSIVPVPGGKFFKEKNITVLLPYEGKNILIATASEGAFLLNTETGELKAIFPSETDHLLKENVPYHGILLPQDRIAFATKGAGVLITDKKGRILSILDKSNGLQDQMVSYIYSNPNMNESSSLWITLNSGISQVEVHSPINSFSAESGIRGQVLDVIRFNGRLYLATSSGIFYQQFDHNGIPQFIQFREPTNTQCFSFLKVKMPGMRDEILMIGTTGGVYYIDKGNQITQVDKQIDWKAAGEAPREFEAYRLHQSKNNPSSIFVGEASGLQIIYYEKGSWKIHKKFIEDLKEEIRSMVEDDEGNLWLGTFLKGVIRIENYLGDHLKVVEYDDHNGFPSLKDNNVYFLDHSVIFATAKGIYTYNKQKNSFVPDSIFGSSYADGSKGVYKIYRETDSIYWVICYLPGKTWVERVEKQSDGSYKSIFKPFRRLPNMWIDAVYPDDNKITWFGISNTLFSFNGNLPFNYEQKFRALIRQVRVGIDSIVFHGAFPKSADSVGRIVRFDQDASLIPILRYSNNNVIFTFAATYFEDVEDIQYTYNLQGFNTTWSHWSPENKAVFTNLSEGKYMFRVKAINVYGMESSEATYAFTILPPWYRTIVAYILYVIFSALFIWGIVKYNTRRLQLEKIRLEGIVKERTAEILKQKDEIELQRDQISAQKKDITDSIRYASRIQRAVLPSERVMKTSLPEHFVLFKPRDIVSGDFYWMTQKDSKIILVAADCTGHGVPGAFMSMLGMSFLNEIVTKGSVTQANQILNELREHVITQLKQTGGEGEDETKDGMDLSLVVIDKKQKNIQFSGANNSMYVIRPLTEEEITNPVDEKNLPRGTLRTEKFELFQVNADKMPIGTSAHNDVPFSASELPMIPGSTLYILSDGYEDQFGGPMGKKFLSKVMKRLLLSLQGKSMEEQRRLLDRTVEDWKGGLDQVDDILVIGIKI